MADSTDWKETIRKRSLWFHECHLRQINLQSMLGEGNQYWSDPDQRAAWGLPDWNRQERKQRDAFHKYLLSEGGDWLGFRRPKKLFDQLVKVQEAFFSRLDTTNDPPSGEVPGYRDPKDDSIFQMVSRLELCQEKPWLAFEMFGPRLVEEEAAEIGLIYGGEIQTPDRGDGSVPDPFLKILNDAARLKSQKHGEPGQLRFTYLDPQTRKFEVCANLPVFHSPGGKLPAIIGNQFSMKASRWMQAVNNPLREAYIIKENSDMGLTHLVRLLYLYGTLANDGMARTLSWRRRGFDAKKQGIFDDYFLPKIAFLRSRLTDQRNRLPIAEGSSVIQQHEDLVRSYRHLREALLLNDRYPGSADFRFSLLVEQVIRSALQGYKYWIDEDFHVIDYPGLMEARLPNDVKESEVKREQQFWSENHTIMFASAEYLLGQLWPADDFLAGRDFRLPDQPKEFLKGEKRRLRGRWRVLKYLNNRLTMGWTEFNSSGYYREHMEPLLNLADFAMDEEVQTKARMVLDLMFFDLARFTHKGSPGGAGGRSQFKSKHTGWGSAIGDVLEIVWGERGIFYDAGGDVPALFATSSYRPPEVLLEMGAHPPEKAYIDRARVSIDFDEAPKYGIGYSMNSRQKRSLEAGYAEKLAKHSPHIAEVEKGIRENHFGYGKKEEDTIFWWTLSAFFNKQNLLGSLEAVKKWKLENTEPFPLAEMLFGSIFEPFDNLGLGALGMVGGAAVGTLAGPLGVGAGAVIGGIKGFGLGGKFINARAMSTWTKVLLIAKSLAFGPVGVAASILALGDPFSREQMADDLSVFLEGSTRTRANLYTYRSRDVMLSSIQNFRPGQLNFQSQVNQATLNTGVSVFTTSAFEGIKFSLVQSALGGGLAAGLTLGPLAAYLGAIAGAIGNELAKEDLGGFLKDDEDGPSWWTGYWALPLVAQFGGAAILIYDFSLIQRQITDPATHVWVPEAGFDQIIDGVRPKNFDDTTWFGGDITEFFSDAVTGENGIWMFGRIIHKQDYEHPEANEEAYIGIFSNNRLDKLNKDSDYYEHEVEKKRDEYKEQVKAYKKAQEALRDKDDIGNAGANAVAELLLQINDDEATLNRFNETVEKRATSEALFRDHKDDILALGRQAYDLMKHPWRTNLLKDYFSGKDRYDTGKNIWIIQVGSRAEFGSFEQFQERVGGARIELDDYGDMSCSYEIPQPGGGSVKLAVDYEDRSFTVGAAGLPVDRYPRFENPFVRSGRVEWGQRAYVIEHNGKRLLHNFTDYRQPVRAESVEFSEAEADRLLALAVYVRTENENMDIFSVAKASVWAGCELAARDEIIAVGEVAENSDHDVEWIPFDRSVALAPGMAIEIEHPNVTQTGNEDPHWRMSFGMRALMADLTWRDCLIDLSAAGNRDVSGEEEVFASGGVRVSRKRFQLNFEDENRRSGLIPFSVRTERWRAWLRRDDYLHLEGFTVARQPDGPLAHHPQGYLLGQEESGRVKLLTYRPCDVLESWQNLGRDPDLPQGMRLSALEVVSGWLAAFAAGPDRLLALWTPPASEGSKVDWEEVALSASTKDIFGQEGTAPIGAIAAIEAAPSIFREVPWVDLYLANAAGSLFTRSVGPGEDGLWRWIKLPGGDAGPGAVQALCVEGNYLFLTDEVGRIWALERNLANLPLFFQAGWRQIGPGEGFRANRFARLRALQMPGPQVRVFAMSSVGELWFCDFYGSGSAPVWKRIGGDRPPRFDPDAPYQVSRSEATRTHVFVAGLDRKAWTATHDPAGNWTWEQIVPQSQFHLDPQGAIFPLSRTTGQLEVFALDEKKRLWTGWWM